MSVFITPAKLSAKKLKSVYKPIKTICATVTNLLILVFELVKVSYSNWLPKADIVFLVNYVTSLIVKPNIMHETKFVKVVQ